MTAPAPRRLLVIAYEFAPAAGGGVARLTSYVRHLRLQGWEPVVLAGAPGPGRPRDEDLLAQIEGVEVVRLPPRNIIWSLARVSGPVRSLLGSARRKRAAAGSGGEAVGAVDPSRPGSPLTTRIARRFAFPDEAVLWARHVERIAPSLCARHRIDVVLASGPPFSALAAGVEVGRRTGLPVVLDMRDQWRDNVGMRWPTQAHKERALELERRTLSAAAAVVGATDGISAEASEMGAPCVETVYNGFDPTQMPPHLPDSTAPLRIAFLGRFSRDVMDPTPFFEGLAAAIRRDPALADVRVDVVGPEAPWTGELVRRLGLSDQVTYHGFRPYAEALGIVSHADVGLMCVADRPGSGELFPGKLFDYLGMGMPLLFVGPADGGVARLARDGGLGTVVGHGDAASVAEAVTSLAAAKAAGRPLAEADPSVAARFDRGTQVARLARLLERVAAGSPAC